MNSAELLEKLKTAHGVVISLKNSILKMCDDMDATNDLVEKEVILQSILVTEGQMDAAEMVYNELLEEIRK